MSSNTSVEIEKLLFLRYHMPNFILICCVVFSQIDFEKVAEEKKSQKKSNKSFPTQVGGKT